MQQLRNGYYLSDYQCLKCGSKCKTCSESAINCLSCNDGFYFTTSNICSECIEPCKTCSNEKYCLACRDNYYKFSDK